MQRFTSLAPLGGPVATYYVPADAGWAACLMVDLQARGVAVWDAEVTGRDHVEVASGAGAILIVHSWHLGS